MRKIKKIWISRPPLHFLGHQPNFHGFYDFRCTYRMKSAHKMRWTSFQVEYRVNHKNMAEICAKGEFSERSPKLETHEFSDQTWNNKLRKIFPIGFQKKNDNGFLKNFSDWKNKNKNFFFRKKIFFFILIKTSFKKIF